MILKGGEMILNGKTILVTDSADSGSHQLGLEGTELLLTKNGTVIGDTDTSLDGELLT